MKKRPVFSKRFFELEYPKLLKLTDSDGNQPTVVMVLREGSRIPLREFQLTDEGLLVNVSSGEYLISYDSIVSVQVVPQALRRVLSKPDPPTSPRLCSNLAGAATLRRSWLV
jgi:hypothetical protein